MAIVDFENLQTAAYIGCGRFEFPKILPENISESQIRNTTFIPFDKAMTCRNRSGKAAHFFIADYRFNRVWNSPKKYLDVLRGFDFVISPDFSIYSDMPEIVRIYNHYRKHWCAAFWQENGIKVIPNISWSDERSFEWCFDGEPENSIVCVSSVGCMRGKRWRPDFIRGYQEMIRRLNPTWVIFYGSVPAECDWNVIRITQRQDILKEELKCQNLKKGG